jgi:hypothetical protein
MKHLLNNISKEEKQSILEQHKGGMKIFNENFNKMVNKKLGHVDLYEQDGRDEGETFRRTNGINLDVINNKEDFDNWKSFSRSDLAYQELTGLELGNAVDSEYEQRMDLLLGELMTFLAQKCETYKDCLDKVNPNIQNLVDVFFNNKNVKLTYNIEPFKYQGKVNLSPFKKYLYGQVDSKLKSLNS